NGNRITSSIHGNGYVTGKGNRLLSDGKYNYEYDNEGNLTKQTEIATGKVQELTWDYRNRLVAFVDKDATGKETQRVEFTYDALNRRIAKAVDTNPQDTTPPVVRQFIYDGQNILLEFVDSDGAGANQPVLDTRYLHGAGVDQVLAQESAGNVEWHLTDHLGTIRDLVNNSGAVVNHFVYDSFGQVISESNPAIDTRYLFTGREFDQEIGLYYYRARYYDANTGRFLSEDPIGFDGGDSNLYRYVSNNTITLIDPFGLQACGCPDEGNSLSRAGQGSANYFGASFLNDSLVRDQYTRGVSNLDPTDSAGRTLLKKQARNATSPLGQEIAEAIRPIKGEGGRIGGTANKTNALINQLYGKPAKLLGGAGLAIGIGTSLYNIGTAPENQRGCVIAQEAGSLVGAASFGAAGTYIGGAIGAAFGGVGAIPGAFIGGLIGSGLGSILGAQAGRNIYKGF
ncbi:MAG: RHS repeat domain-containing protein, partial [Dolichospermum sp.]